MATAHCKASRLCAVLLALVGLVCTAHTGEAMQTADEDAARVRIVHGIADAGALDVYVDGGVALIGIVFAEASSDLYLPAGEHDFVVVPSGADLEAAIAAGPIALTGGTLSYAALIGTVDLASVGLYAIDGRPLDPGLARFRIIAGSPDSPELVPAFTGGDAISPPLAFGDAAEYATIDAGAYDVDILEATSGVPLLSLPQTALGEGVSTDILIVGLLADGTLQTLDLTSDVPVAQIVGRSAQIVAGSCAAPAGAIADLGIVRAGQGETVGAANVALVENSYALAPVAFPTLIGDTHAVLVAGGDEAAAESVACGDVGGKMTDTGSLVVALQSDAGTPAGVAVLAPSLEDPEATGVSVFLTVGGPSGAEVGTPVAVIE